MTRKLINDIRENLEIELLKSLNNKNKQTPVTVQKVRISNRYLDTERQSEILDRMLESYRLYKLKEDVRDFI
jgi:Lhr-like helicase